MTPDFATFCFLYATSIDNNSMRVDVGGLIEQALDYSDMYVAILINTVAQLFSTVLLFVFLFISYFEPSCVFKIDNKSHVVW